VEQVAKLPGDTILHDQTSDRRYFTTVPNIVDDLTESPLDAAVYRAMLRCAGGMGKTCFASTRRIAELARVSPAQVSNSKKALSELKFIAFEGKHPVGDSGQPLDHYSLPDLWLRNMQHFAERSHHEHPKCSPDEQERSRDEHKCSRGETKKGSSRKEALEDTGTNVPEASKIPHGLPRQPAEYKANLFWLLRRMPYFDYVCEHGTDPAKALGAVISGAPAYQL